MQETHSLLAATVLAAAALFASAAQGMEIQQFDKLTVDDQSDYLNLLIEGAQKVLIDDGKGDLAAQVHKLFTTVLPGDKVSVGFGELEVNIDRARVADLQWVLKDPGATRIEVEHAMAVTLKKNGIELPKSFMHVMDDFKPRQPLR